MLHISIFIKFLCVKLTSYCVVMCCVFEKENVVCILFRERVTIDGHR